MDIQPFEKKVLSFVGENLFLPTREKSIPKDGLNSGIISLNLALSGSPKIGLSYGRIGEIYGPESSGKTTLALTLLKHAQDIGLITAFIDMEHALDVRYAEKLGIDMRNMSLAQPDCGEDAIKLVSAMLDSGYRFIVVDSVAAMTPKSELEGEPGDAHMGRLARLMAQSMRMLSPRCSKARAIVMFINQIRANLSPFGASETTAGGNALKFFTSYRIDIRSPRKGKVLVGGIEHGTLSTVKIVKNKLYPPYREAKMRIMYGKGIDKTFDLLEFLFRKKGTKMVKIGDHSYSRKGMALKLRDASLRDKLIERIMK